MNEISVMTKRRTPIAIAIGLIAASALTIVKLIKHKKQ